MNDKTADEGSYCAHPRRVLNDSARGYFYQRCGARSELFCKYCALAFKRDKNIIISSGCEKSDYQDEITEEEIADYDFYALTMTAPSFGAVWNWSTCEDPNLIGMPKILNRYDYKAQILWNANSGKLFHHSIKYLKDGFKHNFEFTAVREWQSRGVLHFHIMFRVLKADNVDESFLEALKKFRTYKYEDCKWGREARVEKIEGIKVSRTVSYLSKALSSDIRQHGKEYQILPDEVRKFYGILDKTAYNLLCVCGGSVSGCTCNNVRSFGWTGHLLSSSKGWSLSGLTLKILKERKKEWVEANRDTFDANDDSDARMDAIFNANVSSYSSVVGSKDVADDRIEKLFESYSSIFA